MMVIMVVMACLSDWKLLSEFLHVGIMSAGRALYTTTILRIPINRTLWGGPWEVWPKSLMSWLGRPDVHLELVRGGIWPTWW